MNIAEKRILVFTSASHFLTHFFMLAFPVLLMPISRGLNLPRAEVVNISFWMYLFYGILALLWGWISDHWGHKWAMACGMILAGIGFVAAGLLTSSALIASAFALVGIGCSAYHPSGVALVSQGVKQRGRAMGISGIWGNIGIVCVPFVVGLLNYFLGWQKSLLVLGLFGLAVGIGTLAVPLSVEKGTDRIMVNKLADKTAGVLFLVMCIGLIFSGFMYRTFTLILPALLESRLGNITAGFRTLIFSRFSSLKDIPAFNTLAAGLIATGVYIAGIIGQLVGGRVADRFSLKWSYFLFFSLALPFVLGMILLTNSWLVLSAGLFVLFTLGMQPIENSLIAFLIPARFRSLGYGLKFTLTYGAGSFAVKFVSLIDARHGIESVTWLVGAFLVLAVLSTAFFLFVSRGHEIRH